MMTMNEYKNEMARFTYIASLGKVNVFPGTDASEFNGQELKDLFNAAIDWLYDALYDDVSDETTGRKHADDLNDAAVIFEQGYYDFSNIECQLRTAIEFLADCGIEDELGTLDALRAGVDYDHIFAV